MSFVLDVKWPSGQIIPMAVRVVPPLADVAPNQIGDAVYSIDSDVLESRASLDNFLRESTRGAGSGETVRAICFEPHVGQLLDLLEVTPPPPERIPVDLPRKGGE